MSRLSRFLMLIFIGLFTNVVLATTSLEAPQKEDQLKQSNIGAYLGTSVEILPNELVAQLPEDVLIGQGIMINGFTTDSPAPKQGLKRYDIVLSLDKRPITHPLQFIQALKKKKPNDKVTLSIVRKGKVLNLPITLGAQKYPLDADQLDYQFNMQVMGYDGFKMKMLSKNYFEATIRFLAPDGIVRRRSFKGYYNQIIPEIQAAPDMTQYAKQKLIGVISERKDDEDGWFGDWMPFSDGNFF